MSTSLPTIPKASTNADKQDECGDVVHIEKPENGKEEFHATSGELEAADDGSHFSWDFALMSNLGALMCCYFTSTWMLGTPSSAIRYIAASFPEDANISIWIAASVTVGNCVLQGFIGDLSDQFGRKLPLLAGMLIGLAGSLIAGRASSMGMVIGGQVLNGIGLTLGYLAIPLSAEIVPKYQRPAVQSAMGITAGIAYMVGPVVSGAFIKHNVGGVNDGWRANYYLGAGFYFITFLALLFFYHPAARPNPDGLSLWARFVLIDWLGILLLTAGLTIFLVGLESGGNPTPWVSGRVLACMIVGGLCLVAFGLIQWKLMTHGLLEHSMFAHENYPVTLILTFVSGIVLFGGQSFLPQEIILLFTSDAIMSGVYNLPFNGLTIGGAIIGGIWMAITKEAKGIVVFSYALLIVGNCLMIVMSPHINYAAWLFPSGILGMTIGIQTALLIVVVSVCTPNHLIAHAVSVVSSTRALGGSIGTVIFSQIFSSKVKNFVPKEIAKRALVAGAAPESLPALIEALLEGNQAALQQIPNLTPQILRQAISGMEHGYSHAFRYVWYSLIPFTVVSLGLSLFLVSTKNQMTRQVAAGVKEHHHHLRHHHHHDYTMIMMAIECSSWARELSSSMDKRMKGY